jgi:hypothetical protein
VTVAASAGIRVVQKVGNATGSVLLTSLGATFPLNVTAGNLLVVAVSTYSG